MKGLARTRAQAQPAAECGGGTSTPGHTQKQSLHMTGWAPCPQPPGHPNQSPGAIALISRAPDLHNHPRALVRRAPGSGGGLDQRLWELGLITDNRSAALPTAEKDWGLSLSQCFQPA